MTPRPPGELVITLRAHLAGGGVAETTVGAIGVVEPEPPLPLPLPLPPKPGGKLPFWTLLTEVVICRFERPPPKLLKLKAKLPSE